jgi:hypothetical protein
VRFFGSRRWPARGSPMNRKMTDWAWSLAMPLAPRMIVLALAHDADDEGFCFPSVAYLAQKCGLDERTVQRMLRKLEREQYVFVEQRRRQNRASTSNGYRLRFNDSPAHGHPVPGTMPPGDPRQDATLPPAVAPPYEGGSVPGGGWQRCHREGGNAAGGTTTCTYPCINYVQPLPNPEPAKGSAPPDGERGGGCRFCFPEGTSSTQREALTQQLAGLADNDAQQILDELAGRMESSHIRDPVRYCAGLVKRFRRSQFRLESGREVARRRQEEQRRQAAPTVHAGATETPGDRANRRMPIHIRDALAPFRAAAKSGQQEVDLDVHQRSSALGYVARD